MNIETIKNQIASPKKLEANAFDILKAVSLLLNQTEFEKAAHELVLRLLDQKEHLQQYMPLLSAMVRKTGLFPYLDPDAISLPDRVAYEFHRPVTLTKNNENSGMQDIVFHRAQANIFRHLMNGESVILSAPTSFGKSLIIDAVIATEKFNNIVIVVPTIALIDETRRRLVRFSKSYKIITHGTQKPSKKNVYVLTQERVVDNPNLNAVDFFVIDEFYKLHPNIDESRAATLNHAFYKLSRMARQFYMLGPNIREIPDGFPERFECRFIRTDYTTVVSEMHSIRVPSADEEKKLSQLCSKLKEKTLIFCGSPGRARKVAQRLFEDLSEEGDITLQEASEWVGAQYHPDWIVAKALRAGIGVHHGRMPRALAQLAVRLFNEGKLRFLICTSTLIEGVNTKARNVVIYDNTIARKKYDHFTFNNIRGRSGRMFQHFIGHVYVFHPEPQEELPFIDIPMFSQDEENTSEALLIQLEDADLKPRSSERLDRYKSQTLLDISVLKGNAGVPPDLQIRLANDIHENPGLFFPKLAWTGFPSYGQLVFLCEVIFKYFQNDLPRVGGIFTGKQLAYRLSRLPHDSLRIQIERELSNDRTKDIDDAVESVLDFLRQWPMHRFGKLAMTVDRIRNALASKEGYPVGDMSFYVTRVENLFLDADLIALDEYGIPIQLAEKLKNSLGSDGNLDKTLEKLKKLDITLLKLNNFEIGILRDAQNYI